MKLKTNLKLLLERRHMTAAALAKASSVPKSSLSDWLAGSTPRNLEHVKRVADILGVSVDELCFADLEAIPQNSSTNDPFTTLTGSEVLHGVFEVLVRRVKR